jgi:hypothetical protein
VSAPALHPRLAELVQLLAEARTELLRVIGDIAPPLAARCPGPGTWSVAQIADHLRIVEAGIVRALTRLLEQSDPATLGPETETSSVLSSLDRYRFEDRRSRLPAPERVRPGESPDLSAALAGLEHSRRQLLDLVERANGLALGTITFEHPALGRWSFYQWLLFIGQHERRHSAQARDVLSQLAAQSVPRGSRTLGALALAAALAALSPAAPIEAQSAAAPLPFDSMARRIVTALQPTRGERAILRSDDQAMPALVPPLRGALEQAGVEVVELGFGPGVDLPGELARSTIYVYLPLGPSTELPPADVEALGRWLDSGKGRQVHFHWTGITTGTDGEPVPVPPHYDQLHLAALGAPEGAMRHRLSRAAELLRSSEVRVATPAGTDLRFRIGTRPICLQDGNAAQASVAGKPLRIDKEIELPAGVLRVAPLEETVAGTLVIPTLRIGTDTARMVQLDFARGRVTDVRAQSGAEAVRAMLAASPALANFRELGIGFNPGLVVPLKEQAIPYAGYGEGMVRLSLGDNRELGGRVSGGAVRWLFFPDATVTAGSSLLVVNGRLAL